MKSSRVTLASVVLVLMCAFLPAGTNAQTIIDRYATIQPIQVANDDGSDPAPLALYGPEASKIYEQAGIAFVFLPAVQINDTALRDAGVQDIQNAGSPGHHANSNTINMWFVHDLPTTPGNILYGEAWVGANGVAINAPAVQSFNGGVGRVDTAAHETGHNLGLGHSNFGAGNANNLMTAGSVRNVPGGGADIAPDGANLDRLTQDQIDQIRASPFVNEVPEVLVDTRGSTPFDTVDFFLLDFAGGPAALSLSSLTMNLGPVNAFFDPTDVPPGYAGSPLRFSNMNGILQSDITVSGAVDGSQELTMSFANDAFTLGDSFQFGIDIDLFSNIDGFGAEPHQLVGMSFSFVFEDGFANKAAIGSDLIASSIRPSEILPFVGQPYGGPVIPAGTVIGTPDPVAAIPAPGAALLVAIGTVISGFVKRPTYHKHT